MPELLKSMFLVVLLVPAPKLPTTGGESNAAPLTIRAVRVKPVSGMPMLGEAESRSEEKRKMPLASVMKLDPDWSHLPPETRHSTATRLEARRPPRSVPTAVRR